MDTSSIISEIGYFSFFSERNDEQVDRGFSSTQKQIEFKPYTDGLKFISFKCGNCDGDIFFGIYSGGGHVRGKGTSFRVKNSWADGLKSEDALKLANFLQLETKSTLNDLEKLLVVLPGSSLGASIYFKKCDTCNKAFIILFYSVGDYAFDQDTDVIVHKILQVKVSEFWIDKYLSYQR